MKLGEFKMPFGKHKGVKLEEIPAGYLLWCDENLDNPPHQLRDYVDQERTRLEKEKGDYESKRNLNSGNDE